MICIDTNYPNYEGYRYYAYEQELINEPEANCEAILKDIDCTKLMKNGMQFHKTTDSMYDENCYRYIRHLFRIKDFIKYNQYLDKLIAQDIANKDFESNLISPVKKEPAKKNTRVSNKYIKTITYDMFTNEEQYLYENFKTGDSFISKNPNLLDELNKPKTKNKEIAQTITLKLKRTNTNIQGNVKT